MHHLRFSTGFTLNERRFAYMAPNGGEQPQIDTNRIDAQIDQDVQKSLEQKTGPDLQKSQEKTQNVTTERENVAGRGINAARTAVQSVNNSSLVQMYNKGRTAVEGFGNDAAAGLKKYLAMAQTPKAPIFQAATKESTAPAQQQTQENSEKPATPDDAPQDSQETENRQTESKEVPFELTREKIVAAAASDSSIVDNCKNLMQQVRTTGYEDQELLVATDYATVEATVQMYQKNNVTVEQVAAFRPKDVADQRAFISEVLAASGSESVAANPTQTPEGVSNEDLKPLTQAKTRGEFLKAFLAMLAEMGKDAQVSLGGKKNKTETQTETAGETPLDGKAAERVNNKIFAKDKNKTPISLADMPGRLRDVKKENADSLASNTESINKKTSTIEESEAQGEAAKKNKQDLTAELNGLDKNSDSYNTESGRLGTLIEQQDKIIDACKQTVDTLRPTVKDLQEKNVALNEESRAIDSMLTTVATFASQVNALLKALDRISTEKSMKVAQPTVSFNADGYAQVTFESLPDEAREALQPNAPAGQPVTVAANEVEQKRTNVVSLDQTQS